MCPTVVGKEHFWTKFVFFLCKNVFDGKKNMSSNVCGIEISKVFLTYYQNTLHQLSTNSIHSSDFDDFDQQYKVPKKLMKMILLGV